MKLDGKAVLITGGASGIGRHLALVLAQKGCKVTVVDLDITGAQQTVREIISHGGTAYALQCDVSKEQNQIACFDAHMQKFGCLDIAFLNAGIGETGNMLSMPSNDAWRRVLEVDLTAVLLGTRLAAAAMRSKGTRGVIVATGSAAGVFPMPPAPVYAAAKAGVVNFTRSVAPELLKRDGIRMCALCPQFVDTPLAAKVPLDYRDKAAGEGNLMTTGKIVNASLWLLADDALSGTVVVLMNTGATFVIEEPRGSLKKVQIPRLLEDEEGKAQGSGGGGQGRPEVLGSVGSLPKSTRSIEVHRLSHDFRAATRLVEKPLPAALPPGCVLLRMAYAGINASDVNYSSGRYVGTPEQAAAQLPLAAGFEGVGTVVAAAGDVTELRLGDAAAVMQFGAFSEHMVVRARHAFPVPRPAPEVISLLTSGLTASIGLQVAGRMRSGETVLVTAAAGGTGQFVVQLAKAAGNRVVATCGDAEKAALLRRLGADRVVNYREEDLKAVLKKEYPKGVDLVWESVGGAMFETCLNALATKGRLVVIGMMSQYGEGWPVSQYRGLPEKLLKKSATLAGFFLMDYVSHFKQHLPRVVAAVEAGRLQVTLDPTPFRGLEQAADAVEHLQSGRSIGKVVLQIGEAARPRL